MKLPLRVSKVSRRNPPKEFLCTDRPETLLLCGSMSDYTKKNIEHFDKRAASYDSPLKQALAKKCTDAFLQAEGVEWNPNSTVVVDFACGTGCPALDCANDRTDLARTGSTCT